MTCVLYAYNLPMAEDAEEILFCYVPNDEILYQPTTFWIGKDHELLS